MEKNTFSRYSNYELLRIISILMVIGLHYLLFGGELKNVNVHTNNYYTVLFIKSMFIIAVNMFILIFGYFMCMKSKVYIKKIINLIFLYYFYGTILYIISVIIGYEQFNLIGFIKSVDPFIKNWYIKTYIVLYLISPYINILLNTLNKTIHKKFIYFLSIFFCIWPSFLPYSPNNDGGYGIISFIYLYIIGAYIRKYGFSDKFKKRSLIIYFSCSLITFGFSVINWDSSWSYNFLFNIIGSMALFAYFSKLKFKSVKINSISKLTFSIFIIHINPLFIDIVYKKILKCNEFYFSRYFVLHLIIGVIIIYIISSVIEVFRIYIFNLLSKIVPKTLNITTNKYINIFTQRVDYLINL